MNCQKNTKLHCILPSFLPSFILDTLLEARAALSMSAHTENRARWDQPLLYEYKVGKPDYWQVSKAHLRTILFWPITFFSQPIFCWLNKFWTNDVVFEFWRRLWLEIYYSNKFMVQVQAQWGDVPAQTIKFINRDSNTLPTFSWNSFLNEKIWNQMALAKSQFIRVRFPPNPIHVPRAKEKPRQNPVQFPTTKEGRKWGRAASDMHRTDGRTNAAKESR